MIEPDPAAETAPSPPNNAIDDATDSLAAALARSNLSLPAGQVAQLEQYARAVWDWNEKLNLTRHTTWEKFVTRDVVDAWQLTQLVHSGESVLDVGTGGGVPGVLMAILKPDLRVAVCDPVGKKAKAVEDIVAQLKLPVRVFAKRAEALTAGEPFDVLVVRAVAPLTELLGWFYGTWDNIGRMLVIKGSKWLDERADARHRGKLKTLELRKAAAYPFPGTESESVILKIWAKGREEPA